MKKVVADRGRDLWALRTIPVCSLPQVQHVLFESCAWMSCFVSSFWFISWFHSVTRNQVMAVQLSCSKKQSILPRSSETHAPISSRQRMNLNTAVNWLLCIDSTLLTPVLNVLWARWSGGCATQCVVFISPVKGSEVGVLSRMQPHCSSSSGILAQPRLAGLPWGLNRIFFGSPSDWHIAVYLVAWLSCIF